LFFDNFEISDLTKTVDVSWYIFALISEIDRDSEVEKDSGGGDVII
jgi:hypothetical protein